MPSTTDSQQNIEFEIEEIFSSLLRLTRFNRGQLKDFPVSVLKEITYNFPRF